MNRIITVATLALMVTSGFAKDADFDLSGKVDLGDFAILADAWQSQEGEPNWNPVCDISDPNDDVIDFNDLLVLGNDWLWTQIVLDVYSDGWGFFIDTIILEEEGATSFVIEEDEEFPLYYDPPEYYAYAYREGYYTELYCFTGTEIPSFPWEPRHFQCDITVDLDLTVPRKFNGTIFMTSWFFADSALADTDVNVFDSNTGDSNDPCDVVASFTTDSQGRFAIEPLPPGGYRFEFEAQGDWPEYHFEDVNINQQYQDFYFYSHTQALKPNIYLYPEQTIQLDVDVLFPNGGRVTTAIPDFNDGWNVTVESSGIIDGQYEYLFYESTQPDYAQYSAGWVISRENLETFFRGNMAQTGFNQKEIDDFVEYWIPRLTDFDNYAIYPQYNDELEPMIELDFSVQPQNVIRLIYAVRGIETDSFTLPEPEIPTFSRDGFTVVEWGVILK